MRTAIRALPALLFALVFLQAAPVHSETHALIMTIGAYKAGITPLRGVQYDAESAKAMAKSMGVKDANMRFYKDGELTLQGMRRAFDELHARVGQGDQVFIYYSGHGGRTLVQDPDDRCAESLITVEGAGFADVDLDRELKRLGAKAQKMVVFLDACHSGGVTTRTTGARSPLFAPKYSARGGADACDRPVNALVQQLTRQTRSMGTGANNYVYVAAARDNEVSLDMPTRGGVATQAWRDCMTGGAIDRDGSGGITAEEVRLCAQERINATLKNVQGFLPHNVTVAGNSNAVLTFAERASTAKPVQASAPAATSAAAITPVSTAAPAEALPAAYHTLRDIFNSRDDRRVVTLEAAKPAFKIGKDDVQFTLSSSHAGYVYLLMVGTDGKTFDMLFPNQLDGAHSIEAGQSVRLPRDSWQIKAGGPAGKNYLLAIVSDGQRDFSRIGMQAAGPFSMVTANPISSKDIQLVSGTSTTAAAKECAVPPSKRTLQVQQRCSNAYGAALMVLEEVN